MALEVEELQVFRDYSGWDEPAISTPIGYVSMRGLAVLGVLGGLSGLFYHLIIPENLEITRDWAFLLGALTPFFLGLLLAVLRPPFGSADTVVFSLLTMRREPAKKSRRKPKSRVLGFPRKIRPGKEGDETQEIICSDLEELKFIKMTLHDGRGGRYANVLVKMYLDDELHDTMRTTAEGVLTMHVTPEKEGGRTLVIRRSEDDAILLKKHLHFSVRAR